MEVSEEYLTAAQLAELLQVPEKTVLVWRREGSGPPSGKFGRHIRFRRSDVDNWAAARVGVVAATSGDGA